MSDDNFEFARLLSNSGGELDQQDEIDEVDQHFDNVLKSIQEAFELGIGPVMILQGSSGSYFLRDKNENIVGVFKPKDEEPYGANNPKWIKWIHRVICPCLFGRSCLIPNVGYLSEAGACLVDRKLGLGIVPTTKIVKLSHPNFHYRRTFMSFFRKEKYPKKRGSLQLFVRGYGDAQVVLPKIPTDNVQVQTRLTYLFQKLVILDYITRNTDRGNDNWLLKISNISLDDVLDNVESSGHINRKDAVNFLRIEVAAIDNGLSFPIKHPDNWRTYPYYWGYLEQAKIPFTNEIVQEFLPKLKDGSFAFELIKDLYRLFKQDEPFSKSLFKKQASVVRGQIFNLTKALEHRLTPYELLEQPLCIIKMEQKFVPTISPQNTDEDDVEFLNRGPCFSWC